VRALESKDEFQRVLNGRSSHGFAIAAEKLALG
jgi:hypothetical protein